MSGYTVGKSPLTAGEWGRDVQHQIEKLFNPQQVRVGPWVIYERDGGLWASRPGEQIADLLGGVATPSQTVNIFQNAEGYVTQNQLASLLQNLQAWIGGQNLLAQIQEQFQQGFVALYTQLTGLLNPVQAVNAIQAVAELLRLQFAAPVAAFRLPFLPVGSIASNSPELLPNPGFDGSAAVDSNTDGWMWDGTRGHTSNGSVKIVADGENHTLVAGNTVITRIPVDVDQQIPVSVWVYYEDVVANASSNAIRLSVSGYNELGLVSTTMVAGVLSPSGDSGGWVQLTGTYVVPSGIDEIILELNLTSAASAGTVWYDDASLKKTNLMPMSLVDNLVNSWNQIYEAFTGAVGATVTEVANAWKNLLSVLQIPSLASLIVNPGAFNPVTFIQQFITEGLNPQNMLAQLETAGANAGRLLFEQAPAALQDILNGIPGLAQGAAVVNQTADDFLDAWESTLNAIQQGVTGTAQTIGANIALGVGGAEAQINDVANNIRQQFTGLQNQVAALFGLVPQTAVAAAPAGIDDIARTSTASSNDWNPPAFGTFTVTVATPAVFTLAAHGLITGDPIILSTTGALPTGLSAGSLYFAIPTGPDTFNVATTRANALAGTAVATTGTQSGTHSIRRGDWTIIAATGTTHADGTSIVWDKSGAAARFVIGRYNRPTVVQSGASTSYQKAKFVMSALMENPTNSSAPDAGNMLIAHALADFTEFVYLRLKHNKVQLGYYQGTADVTGFNTPGNWRVFEEMTPSGKLPLADWELICGDIVSARKYIGQSLGARQLSDTNSGFTLTADHVYSGMGFFSDDQGSFESAPGSISLFQLDNYSPAAYPGSGMSVYRTNTAVVTATKGSFKLPGGFFDSVEYISPDLIWDSTNGLLYVTTSGHYGFEISLYPAAAYTNHAVGIMVCKNGAISGKRTGTKFADVSGGVHGYIILPLMAGDYIQPSFFNAMANPGTINLTGESTGTATYMTVAKLNP